MNAPSTTDAPPASSRRRRWPIPAPTPAELLLQPRQVSAWAAYPVLAVVYLLVFGYPLAGIVTATLTDQAAPRFPAPNADTFWALALSQWIMHAVLLGLTFVCLWLVCRWLLRMPIAAVFNRTSQQEATPHRSWGQGWRVFVCAFAAIVTWMVGMDLLSALMPEAAVGGPVIEDRADAVWTVLMLGPAQLTTALVEEPIVVGLLVVLLTAARRPAWEIYTLAILAKIAYHLTYGLPVLALVPAALVIVWLYRRTGRLWPVILAHAAYNLCFSALVIAWPATFG
ncbi:CPBP family intramembrane glutamic endopeptidase [Nocardiopsis alborubida]|uniref:CPBP family intramembrane metalloprotease n=1 Tax=Nocardiopsis alborubida TaxID=146802 RepID=A0A7X6M8W8_9ACTN|nr:CPBP family intramembrane glutamic endopeptidase [Nocardiopsis alborubida]NKY96756.1 CPBP family intramembrane metalloprotease [Nocardiopsis alborubida]